VARICCHNAGSAGAAESQTSIFPLWTRSRKARGDSPATRRKLGAITVCDAAPARDKQVAYNRMERLRDPSHAAALCPEQLQALFEGQGLRVQGQQQYRLEVALADSLAASFPEPGDAEKLRELFEKDLGVDELGVGVTRRGEALWFSFPILILSARAR